MAFCKPLQGPHNLPQLYEVRRSFKFKFITPCDDDLANNTLHRSRTVEHTTRFTANCFFTRPSCRLSWLWCEAWRAVSSSRSTGCNLQKTHDRGCPGLLALLVCPPALPCFLQCHTPSLFWVDVGSSSESRSQGVNCITMSATSIPAEPNLHTPKNPSFS